MYASRIRSSPMNRRARSAIPGSARSSSRPVGRLRRSLRRSRRSGEGERRRGLAVAAEDPQVGVDAVAGGQWLALGQAERAAAVRSSLAAKEESMLETWRREAMRQVEQVRDEQDLDPGVQHRADHLPRDLGALALVRSRERLVA